MDFEPLMRTGVRAAYRSGEILRQRYGKLASISKKGPTDLVTDADLAAEAEILATILAAYPEDSIVSEEKGCRQGPSARRWIVDPLDGTVNYAHQIPFFAVSIACLQGEEALIGIVFNPLNGELFTAKAGGGAQLNGESIRVSPQTQVSESLLATGFPYDLSHVLRPLTQRFLRVLPAARGIRRLGSAALDLSYVACGRFAGYWEENLKPWDSAAGILIVREAGGIVTDFCNRPAGAYAGQILATNGAIHADMLTLMEISDN
jgi:myo-inositol-1(or 4)-monophosphatase